MKRRTFISAVFSVPALLAATPAKAQTAPLAALAKAPTLDVSPVPFDPVSLKGRPVVVAFFASWCPPCAAEFKHLAEAMSHPKGQDAVFVGVNIFEAWGGKKNPARMARFLKKTNPKFPLVDGDDDLSLAFGDVDRIPTMVIFDRMGREVWRFVHVRNARKTHATATEVLRALEGV